MKIILLSISILIAYTSGVALSQESVDRNKDVRLEISASKQKYFVGEEIRFSVKLTNISNIPIELYELGLLSLNVKLEKKGEKKEWCSDDIDGKLKTITLTKNSYTESEYVCYLWFQPPSEVCTYVISVFYKSMFGGLNINLIASTEIIVDEPDIDEVPIWNNLKKYYIDESIDDSFLVSIVINKPNTRYFNRILILLVDRYRKNNEYLKIINLYDKIKSYRLSCEFMFTVTDSLIIIKQYDRALDLINNIIDPNAKGDRPQRIEERKNMIRKYISIIRNENK